MLANGPRRKRNFAVAALATALVSAAAVCGQDASRTGLGLVSFDRVLLYNTTGAAASVSVFAYRSR